MTVLGYKLIAAALLALALLGGYAAWHHHVTGQQHDADIAEQREADARQAAANQATREAQARTQQENANEATRLDTARADAARGLDATVQRLRDHYAVGAAPAARAGLASASAASSVPQAGMVPAEVYFRAVDAAAELAKYADCLESGGELCAHDYDALKPP